MEFMCLGCRKKVEVDESPIKVFRIKTGLIAKSICPQCGKTVSRILKKEEGNL